MKLSELLPTAFHDTWRAVINSNVLHIVEKGGRGSGKSSDIAHVIIQLIMRYPVNAVAIRFVDNTIELSIFEQLKWAIEKGAFANILGVDIIRSNKAAVGHGFLVKITADPETDETEPAFKIIMKRAVEVEKDRDIIHGTTVLTANEHYGAYLYDPLKVVKFTTA